MIDAKREFPPTRKITMYDYSDSVQRYNDLRVLEEEAATIPVNIGEGGRKTFGPVLPQALDVDFAKCCNILDPIRVLGRGARRKS
jgi:zinc finger SWIM domain-containing protein 3